MGLRLVGAGLPRTGTSSLREALRSLLGGPVHHMSEVFAHPEQAPTWVAAIGGRPPDWAEFLAGYVAGVDVPFATCWRSVAATYPEAPVLLSRRADAATWHRSMAATVLPRAREVLAGPDDDPLVPLFRAVFADLGPDLDDREALEARYEDHLAAVRAEVGPGRLVEWEPGDGWGPLCSALGVAVPDRPFPHKNSTADHAARRADRARRDAARLAAVRSSRAEPYGGADG